MKKIERKQKKTGFRDFLIVIVLLSISLLVLNYFGKLDTIKSYFSVSEKVKNIFEKPKLKIVDEKSNSRVIAVIINNNHVAWPHAGLQDAFLNYEFIAEGGITRIMSLFKDKDTTKIGSVRSARHYFLDYVLENDAIFVHFGHSKKALSDIKTLGINNINGMFDSRGFWRDRTIKKAYEHTAFTSMAKIKKVAAQKKYRMTSDERMLLNYSVYKVKLSKREESIKADKVKIVYSGYTYTTYEYDEETNLYYRSMSGKKHVDAITGKQYTTRNIITYKIKNASFDSYGRQDLKNIGTGDGYYISDGYAVPIKWEKESRDSQTVYKYLDGKEIDVNDGVTWIQIQPADKKLTIEANKES